MEFLWQPTMPEGRLEKAQAVLQNPEGSEVGVELASLFNFTRFSST